MDGPRAPEQVSPEIKAPIESKLPGLKSAGKTEASSQHPEKNEDCISRSEEYGFATVLDGLGGHHSGDLASRAARTVLSERLRSIPANADLDTAKKGVSDALVEASAKVLAELPGAGTTAVVAKFLEIRGQREVIIGSVGDSRAYILRGGKLTQITEDDSMIKPGLPRAKALNQKLDAVETQQDLDALNEDERIFWGIRHRVMQSLGNEQEPPIPHIYHERLQTGDKVILTSDGVHDNLSHREIEQIASGQQDVAGELVKRAKARSADGRHVRSKPDDISAVVVEAETAVFGNDLQKLQGEQAVRASLEKAQASNDRRESQAESRLVKGSIVTVVRSSGETESGWRIDRYDEEGQAVVQLTDKNGKGIQKKIPPVELYSINRPDDVAHAFRFEHWQKLWERAGGAELLPGEKPPERLTPREARAFFANKLTEDDLKPTNHARVFDSYKHELMFRAFGKGKPMHSEAEIRRISGT